MNQKLRLCEKELLIFEINNKSLRQVFLISKIVMMWVRRWDGAWYIIRRMWLGLYYYLFITSEKYLKQYSINILNSIWFKNIILVTPEETLIAIAGIILRTSPGKVLGNKFDAISGVTCCNNWIDTYINIWESIWK